jgi:hypothetical protein
VGSKICKVGLEEINSGSQDFGDFNWLHNSISALENHQPLPPSVSGSSSVQSNTPCPIQPKPTPKLRQQAHLSSWSQSPSWSQSHSCSSRIMFQPTQALFRALRRLALTTKQAANKGGYYKGNRTGSMGWHTKRGRYVVDYHKVRTYVAPRDTLGLPIKWSDNPVRTLRPRALTALTDLPA